MNRPLPFVSILIPIRNESAYLERCLLAISKQDYPPELLEVLVADGQSTDQSCEIVRDYSETLPNLVCCENPDLIVPTGMNILIPKSRGDVVIRVDGHCVIAPDYVSNCVRHLQSAGVDGVGGPMKTIGEDFVSEVIALAMSSKFGVGNSSFRTETGQTKLADTVPFPAYTREIIQKVGLYDEELVRNQDDEYNYRIREAGGSVLLAADVQSSYFSRGSFSRLWNQYYQYGFWKVRVLQKHPRQMSLRQFVPPVFVLSLIVCALISLIFYYGWRVLLGFVSLYLAANLAASCVTGWKKGLRVFFTLPLTFAIIHLSYGWGFLVGLSKFRKRWKDKLGKVPPWKP